MENITNEDIVFEMYDFIKKSNDIKEFIKEYGGGSVYIPAYKRMYRDDDIKNKYAELKKSNTPKIAFKLALEYELTERQIYEITREIRRRRN